jgi:hypothetical protein
MTTSIYKAYVQTYGDRSLSTNGLEFVTAQNADEYADNLASRWTMVQSWLIIRFDQGDPPPPSNIDPDDLPKYKVVTV